jgi:hypothetical protein
MIASKLAIFVEGQTEQIFVEKLIEEIAGAQNVKVIKYQATGGASCSRKLRRLDLEAARAEPAEPAKRYHVQIVDCSTESRVASDILENYESLVRSGFKTIIGIRDVYPMPRADLPKLRKRMTYRQPTRPVAVDNVLAVMEVEAWFLGEHLHFSQIGSGIAIADIVSALGFDPSTGTMEDREHPAGDLDRIYRLGGRAYNKKSGTVQATVGALDYEHMYCVLRHRMESLGHLMDALDRFLGPA